MPEESSYRNIDERHTKKGFGLPDFNLVNVLVVVLSFALIVAGLYIYKPEFFKGLPGKAKTVAKPEAKEKVGSSGYSAVFLTNNQVYFGKLSDAGSGYPKLTDVYYLRVQRPLQPPPATEEAQPDVQLVKLGNELHGPVDEIRFNREQILYIEDLKDDSRIVQAIKEFKSRQ